MFPNVKTQCQNMSRVELPLPGLVGPKHHTTLARIPQSGPVFVFFHSRAAGGCGASGHRVRFGCCWTLCEDICVCKCTCSFATRVSSTFPWRESQGCECCSCLCRFSATARSRRTRYSPVDWPPPSSTEVCCCFTMFVSQQVFSSVYVRK